LFISRAYFALQKKFDLNEEIQIIYLSL
jgi:hypothetical protein